MTNDDTNEQLTIENAKHVLTKYSDYRILEIRHEVSIKSPSFSGMPSSQQNENNQENKMVDKIDKGYLASSFCKLVRLTIDSIDNFQIKELLTNLYINNESNAIVMNKLHLSKTPFFKLKKIALLTFGKAFIPTTDPDGNKINTWVKKRGKRTN